MAQIANGVTAGRRAPPPARAVPLPFILAQPWITEGDNNVFRCGMCNMWLNGIGQLRDHLVGSKHRKHAREAYSMRCGEAMRTIALLLVTKWMDERKAFRRGALLMALKIWAGPRWTRALMRSRVPRESLDDWVLLPHS